MYKEISKPQKTVTLYVLDTGVAFHHFYSIRHDGPCCHYFRHKAVFWCLKELRYISFQDSKMWK